MNTDLEALLRSALTADSERTMSLTDTSKQHARLQQRLGRDRRGRRVALITFGSAATVVAVLAAALLVNGGDDRTSLEPPTNATPSSQPAPAGVLVETPLALPAAAIPVRGQVTSAPLRHNLAFAAGSLWSVSSSGTELLRIDPRTARTAATVPLRLPPEMMAEAVIASGTFLVLTVAPPSHVTSDDTSTPNAAYVVVDATRAVQTASVPAYVDFGQHGNRVAVGPGGTWVQSGKQEFAALDVMSGRLGRRLTVPGSFNGFAVGSDALWTPSFNAGTVTRIGLSDGRATTSSVGSGPINAAAIGTDGIVWRAGRLLRLTGAPPVVGPTAELPYGQGGKADFAIVGDSLYCVCGIGGQLAVLTGTFTAGSAFEVPGSDGETSITAGGGRLWLLLRDGSLLGIDPTVL